MSPFFLKIDVDAEGKVTVREKRHHRWNANGGTPVIWKADMSKFKSWKINFPNGTPFEHDETEFGNPGKPGGQLISYSGNGPVEYSYDVTCIDRQDNRYDSDPEIVLWPD